MGHLWYNQVELIASSSASDWNTSATLATASQERTAMDTSDSSTVAPVYVYFIRVGYFIIKIGISDDPKRRISDMQTAHYDKLHLLATLECTDRSHALLLERFLHAWFHESHLLNEWFDVGRPDLLIEFIKVLSVSYKTRFYYTQEWFDEMLGRTKNRTSRNSWIDTIHGS